MIVGYYPYLTGVYRNSLVMDFSTSKQYVVYAMEKGKYTLPLAKTVEEEEPNKKAELLK